jgi:hypothetical protein
MSTDLKAVPDRPQTILRKKASSPRTAPRMADRYYTIEAASTLDKHEADNGVTFTALDNDALTAVREAYAAAAGSSWATDTMDRAFALEALSDAVRDLLGLGE